MNRNILIAGGSSGIGIDIAHKLCARRSNRCILLSSSKDKLIEAKKRLVNVDIYQYNLEDVVNIAVIFEDMKLQNIIVNDIIYCAGISPLCLLKDNSCELMEKVFKINCLAFLEMTRQFQKHTLEGGKIIAIGSITKELSGYRQVLYGSSKNAMVSFVQLLAPELLSNHITINCISPGVTDTPMFSELTEQSPNLREKVRKAQPMGVIPPDKIANLVEYLLSSECDYITGKEWVYDGGALI